MCKKCWQGFHPTSKEEQNWVEVAEGIWLVGYYDKNGIFVVDAEAYK